MRQRCPLIVSFEYVCVYVFIYMNEHLCTYTHTSINVSIDISIEKRTFILNVQALHCANGSVTLLLKCCSGKGCLCGSIVDNATCNLAAHPIVNHGTSCNFLSIFSYIIDSFTLTSRVDVLRASVCMFRYSVFHFSSSSWSFPCSLVAFTVFVKKGALSVLSTFKR